MDRGDGGGPVSAAKKFIKSAGTSTPSGNSQAAIERLLARYGALGTSFSRRYDALQNVETIQVEFVIPDSFTKNAGKVPVRIPVNVRHIYVALFDEPRERSYPKPDWKHARPERYAQAERVAWRNLLLWIDAALSAAAVGAQTITEAFLAHTLVSHENGKVERMMDYLDTAGGALAPGVRALLAAPATEAT